MNQDNLPEEIYSKMFSRNILTLGQDRYNQVFSSKVAVIGIGGVGSALCEMLTRLGIQNLMYFARGNYELPNINRQIPATYISVKAQTKKIHALAQRLYEINPFIEINAGDNDVLQDKETVLENLRNFSPKIIFNCVDECQAQLEIASISRKLNIPFFIGGVTGIGTEGIVTCFHPDGISYEEVFPVFVSHRELLRQSKLLKDDARIKMAWVKKYGKKLPNDVLQNYTKNLQTPYPVLTPLPWMIASLMVTEFIKFLLEGYPMISAPDVLFIQPLHYKMNIVNLVSANKYLQFYPWRP